MVNLAIIFHMHQPYYKNLLTKETPVPWVRFHGTKDYLDMVKELEDFPDIKLTFNLVPSLIEQIQDYSNKTVIDKFLELSRKPVIDLSHDDKEFIRGNFFMINRDTVINRIPRYYELFLKKQAGKAYTQQDYLDLQVWFNLAWTDPYFRQRIPELRAAETKGRFFTEKEKQVILKKHLEILEDILPVYKEYVQKKQIEVTISPYYHPILPLLYNTTIAKEANINTVLPDREFAYPADAKAQIKEGVRMYESIFGSPPPGMWPSEEGVCEHIVPYFIQNGIRWIVTDEGLLFKSLKMKKRDARLIYQPHLLKRKEGRLNIVFRDRNLSDLIGFVYNKWSAEDAVKDFIGHLRNINEAYKGENVLVTIAMDGENAWEYYPNDGHDFLRALYKGLSEEKNIKTVTINEYLDSHPPKLQIRRLGAGSWIYSEFFRWIGNPYKNKAWEYLAAAREELKNLKRRSLPAKTIKLAVKQMYICEGSDWFWWYGDNQEDFDRMFRMHLSNFYTIIGKPVPAYLNRSLYLD